MSCARCGVAGEVDNGFQVDHVVIVTNGIVRQVETRLCRDCRAIAFAAWSRATAPVGMAAA